MKASEKLKVYRSRYSWCRTTHPKLSKGWWKYLLLEEWRKNGCSSWSKNILKYHIIDSPEAFPFETIFPFETGTQKPDTRKAYIMYGSSGLSLNINFYVKTFLKFTRFLSTLKSKFPQMFYLIYLNRNDVSSKQHHKFVVSCEIEAYLVFRCLVDGGSSMWFYLIWLDSSGTIIVFESETQ